MYLIARIRNKAFNIRTIFSTTGTWDPQLNLEAKKEIEAYWKDRVNSDQFRKDDGVKHYVLPMFPYPSGSLHMGHVRVYTLSDVMARFFRMRGKKVIHPIGWDAFGLPAENAAKDKNIHPAQWTTNNIATMKQQLTDLNISFDWNRELATCDPSYYKWTQYFFLLMYSKGLAYKKKALVNWDPIDQTVLADEQVDENGCSWRSGAKVEKRMLAQWFFRTTAFSKDDFKNIWKNWLVVVQIKLMFKSEVSFNVGFCDVKRRLSLWILRNGNWKASEHNFCYSASKFAQSLHDGLNDSKLEEFRDVIKIQQHWIGECSGFMFNLEVQFQGVKLNNPLSVWIERPELIFGATFIAISPKHHFNSTEWGGRVTNGDHLLQLDVIHPFTGKLLPVFVTDAVDHSEATDSYIGIPGSMKEQDLQFAARHNLQTVDVFDGSSTILLNSEQFSGMNVEEAREKIVNEVRRKGIGGYQTSTKLRDWLISRQRYWGTPIPIINCQSCKVVPVPFEDLPVVLPNLTDFGSKGMSPLAAADDWYNVKCPRCGENAVRETDTMDTFVDSSWYFLRYLDPDNSSAPFDRKKANSCMPVDLYIGGKEHAALHLYYARFMSYFLHSLGLLENCEPFRKLLMQGMILAKSYQVKETGKYIPSEEVDFIGRIPVEKATGAQLKVEWEKMSKSKCNGIDPKNVIEQYGIDATRLFILGSVAPASPRKWSSELFPGILNWQRRLWLTISDFLQQRNDEVKFKYMCEEEIKKYENILSEGRNYYIKGITNSFQNTCQLNVTVAKLQGLSGTVRGVPKAMGRNNVEYEHTLATLIIMLAPLAPHFASELWNAFCSVATGSSHYDVTKPVLQQSWPEVDMEYNLCLNLKVNEEECEAFKIPRKELDAMTRDNAIQLALSSEKLQMLLNGKNIKKILYKPQPGCDAEIIILTGQNNIQNLECYNYQQLQNLQT